MGGKGGSGSAPTSAQGQQYLAANPDVARDPYFAANPYQHYLQYGQAEGRPLAPGGGGGGGGFELPEFGGGSHAGAHGGFDYEQQQADQQAAYDQQLEDQQRLQGLSDRDALYSSYLTAANTASEYVSGEISDEMSNAALLGIDYNITDELKSTRINDYFATIWGAGDQSRLEGLFGEWGKPAGFSGFDVTRGDASSYAGSEASETEVSKSVGVRPTLATEDEDILGTTKNVLGV